MSEKYDREGYAVPKPRRLTETIVLNEAVKDEALRAKLTKIQQGDLDAYRAEWTLLCKRAWRVLVQKYLADY